MASASTTEEFSCSVEQFFSIITDFDKYSEFLSEVKQCRVVEENGNQKIVEYHVSVIKDFKYRLKMTEEAPNRLSWVLDSGDLFKVSNGSWDLEDVGGRTRATYAVEAKFKVFVPGPVAKALVSVNLPGMMEAYHKRVKELFS